MSPSSGSPQADATEQPEEVIERKLREHLMAPDELGLDESWKRAQAHVLELALRPAKRLRPRLLHLGFLAGGGEVPAPDALWTFATGLETLHTFLLIHDDIADHSELRRGGATLHLTLNSLGAGEDLATVVGDHLFARSVELLMGVPLPTAIKAASYYLRICRHTAVGQYLDIVFSRRKLAEVTAFEAVKVADLKTARYSFAAPLACGAMLASAAPSVIQGLERVGRLAGLAFQLQDDLLGVLGNAAESGKSADGDLREAKRTFPLLIAYRRASASERQKIEALCPDSTADALDDVRAILRDRGGVAATERAITRATQAALRALKGLDLPGARVAELLTLVEKLAQRHS